MMICATNPVRLKIQPTSSNAADQGTSKSFVLYKIGKKTFIHGNVLAER